MDSNNRRIAKNTLLLYVRMLFTMVISLYTSRVVLNTLGVTDYGIYNVVGGVVLLFSFINMSLSTASSRFINYELGRNDECGAQLNVVFSTCIYVHFIVALLILVLSETVGLYIICTQIQIPSLRFDSAIWVYHLSVFSICLGVIFTPFNASIIAHEKMSAFAYISILEVIGKLLIVYLLPVVACDRLMLYSFLLFGMTLIVQSVYLIYCYRNFNECRRLYYPDKKLMKRMSTFTGWNLLGDTAYALFSQGLNLLLNMFFGTVVNAARAIAVQVNGVVLRFVQSFQTAVNPQIIQSCSNCDMRKMHDLVIMSSRYTFLLISILAVPIMFNTDFLLSIWLVEVPQFTLTFIKIMIMITCFDSLGYSMTVAINATGKNKYYQLWVSGTMLLICPISYLCLKVGAPPYSVFLCHFIIGVVAHVFRVYWVHKVIKLPYKPYMVSVFVKGTAVVVSSSLFILIVKQMGVVNSWFLLFVSFFVTCLSVLIVGLNGREKNYLYSRLKNANFN